ncbi:MAG TPA: LptF/LptG family permease, partial [Longimicrobiales bacterium]
DGHIHDLQEEQPDRFQRVFFERQDIRMRDVGNMLERSAESHRGEREMGFGMLADEADGRRAELAEIQQEAADLALAFLDRTLAGDPSMPIVARAHMAADVVDEPALDSAAERARTDRTGGDSMAVSGDVRVAQPPAPPVRAGMPDKTARFELEEGLLPGRRPMPRPAMLARAAAATDTRPLAERDNTISVVSGELSSLASRARTKQLQINSYEVEYQKKLAIPFACLVFVLIGAPLAVRFPRGGVGMVIAISLGIFAIYYVGLIGGEKLADKGHADPFWAMWAPNAIFLLLGVWGMTRIGHESSTSRGGGWDDLWFTARRFVTKPFRKTAAGVGRHASESSILMAPDADEGRA